VIVATPVITSGGARQVPEMATVRMARRATLPGEAIVLADRPPARARRQARAAVAPAGVAVATTRSPGAPPRRDRPSDGPPSRGELTNLGRPSLVPASLRPARIVALRPTRPAVGGFVARTSVTRTSVARVVRVRRALGPAPEARPEHRPPAGRHVVVYPAPRPAGVVTSAGMTRAGRAAGRSTRLRARPAPTAPTGPTAARPAPAGRTGPTVRIALRGRMVRGRQVRVRDPVGTPVRNGVSVGTVPEAGPLSPNLRRPRTRRCWMTRSAGICGAWLP
jgi:hypothetical protein